MSRILDALSSRFATPVSRPENESPLKTNTSTAPPLPISITKAPSSSSLSSSSASTSRGRPPANYPQGATTTKRAGSVASLIDTKFYSASGAPNSSSPRSSAAAADYSTPPSTFRLHSPAGPELSVSIPPGQVTDALHPNSNKTHASSTSTDTTTNSANGGGGGGFELMSWSGDQLNQALADLLGDGHNHNNNNNPPSSSSTTSSSASQHPFSLTDPSSSSSSSTYPHMLQSQSHTSAFDYATLGTSQQYPWLMESSPSRSHSADRGAKQHYSGLSFLSSEPFATTSNTMGNNTPSPSAGSGRGGGGGSASAHEDSETAIVPTETDTVRYEGSATGMHHQALESSYTGSFWYVINHILRELYSSTDGLIEQFINSLDRRSPAAYNMDDGSISISAAPGSFDLSVSQLTSIHGSSSSLHQSVELPPRSRTTTSGRNLSSGRSPSLPPIITVKYSQ